MIHAQFRDLPATAELFVNWLRDNPRLPFVYHRGRLDLDRRSKAVREVAQLAMQAFELGKVELVQKKISDNHYHYIAIPRRYVDKKREQVWLTKQLSAKTPPRPKHRKPKRAS